MITHACKLIVLAFPKCASSAPSHVNLECTRVSTPTKNPKCSFSIFQFSQPEKEESHECQESSTRHPPAYHCFLQLGGRSETKIFLIHKFFVVSERRRKKGKHNRTTIKKLGENKTTTKQCGGGGAGKQQKQNFLFFKEKKEPHEENSSCFIAFNNRTKMRENKINNTTRKVEGTWKIFPPWAALPHSPRVRGSREILRGNSCMLRPWATATERTVFKIELDTERLQTLDRGRRQKNFKSFAFAADWFSLVVFSKKFFFRWKIWRKRKNMKTHLDTSAEEFSRRYKGTTLFLRWGEILDFGFCQFSEDFPGKLFFGRCRLWKAVGNFQPEKHRKFRARETLNMHNRISFLISPFSIYLQLPPCVIFMFIHNHQFFRFWFFAGARLQPLYEFFTLRRKMEKRFPQPP